MPKPNFTGTWKFNPKLSSLQIKPPESTIFVIDHQDKKLRLQRKHLFEGKEDIFSIELEINGNEVITAGNDYNVSSSAYWESKTLVFNSTIFRKDLKAANIVRYSLSSDGNVITAQEHFRSAELNYDNIWIMDKIKRK
ncbi:MAG TPA: hypothetical protein VMT35_18965 [Ignavibacteriaceae bacterium]|nr:hypothetical protein [Ignavibacteriaceae bacterium]